VERDGEPPLATPSEDIQALHEILEKLGKLTIIDSVDKLQAKGRTITKVMGGVGKEPKKSPAILLLINNDL